MNASEGMRRIAAVIKVLGWIWLLVLAILAIDLAFKEGAEALFIGGIGIIGIVVARTLAWIIEGFGS